MNDPGWAHLRIDRRSASWCRVSFAHPPSNAIGATMLSELTDLAGLIEQDDDLEVVVFDTAVDGAFLGDLEPGVSDCEWSALVARLGRLAAHTIAAIRGRGHGAGLLLVLACDERLAARGQAVLGPFPPAAAAAAGGGRAAGRQDLQLTLVDAERLDAAVEAAARAQLGHFC